MAHSRIDDLRRRVEADPASIAFAQLAEEYRRAGQTEEAVRVSREGLNRHPGYLSARVTLGRALLDLGQLDEARLELQFVATEAPENLAAIRGLAEIFHREGDAASALEYFQRALALARHDPELEEIVQQLSRQAGAEAGPSSGLTFEEAHQELLSAADRMAPAAGPVEAPAAPGGETAPFDFDTLVAALGTPAASPLVESVVRGETPAIFELPDMPAAGDDPFAALEAELRAQEAPAPIADEVAALADEIEEVGAPRAVAPPEEPWADQIDDGGQPPDADPPDTAAASWAPHEVVATSADVETPQVEGEAAAVDLAWIAEAPAESAVPPAAPEDSVLELSWPAADVEVAPSSATEETEPMETPRGADDASDAGAPGGAEQPDRPAEPAAPAARAKGDDVLNDLEDWLNTLQDRSSQ